MEICLAEVHAHDGFREVGVAQSLEVSENADAVLLLAGVGGVGEHGPDGDEPLGCQEDGERCDPRARRLHRAGVGAINKAGQGRIIDDTHLPEHLGCVEGPFEVEAVGGRHGGCCRSDG